ncbi:MAG: PSD1 domain-containing protein [Akkermansiaceae bacterium]|nr:PSD1 domain-containing protein [Akkermansiaceae bacterium]
MQPIFIITILLCTLVVSCSKKTDVAQHNSDPKQAQTLSPEKASSLSLPDQVTFNAHIRPIFSDKCFSCHGFDQKKREADLRLDTPEGAYAKLKESDGRAIVPGKPDQSDVWKRIVTNDPETLMPPEDFHKPITQHERGLIRRWIEQGAEYEKHWAYRPIKNPPVPGDLKHQDKVANAIDAFVINRLEKENLSPSDTADKRTLLRRLALDLTGLPPTPEELAVFLADTSPDAYEKQVDRLLASPHYGERMAVTWLDVARYADTVGFHGDQNQHIFPYRDYVIDAFNQNMPFDQFTIEQLAGDLLDNPTPEQRIATGFIRLSQMTREGGAQPLEYLAKYASDRVRAVGAAWLGQTTGCAECHDHKFDPITAKDFYSLSAFFKDVKQWGVYSHYQYTPNRDLVGFNNDSPFPPEILVQSPSLLRRLQALRAEAHRTNAALAKTTPQWEQATIDYLTHHPTGWATATPLEASSSKNTNCQIKADGTVIFSGAPQKGDVITLKLKPDAALFTAIRLEILPDASHGGMIGRSKDGNFAMTRPEFYLMVTTPDKPEPVSVPIPVTWAQADHFQAEQYRSGYTPVGFPKTWRPGNQRWSLPNDFQKRTHTAIFILELPVGTAPDNHIKVTLNSADVGAVRISTTRFGEPVAGQPAVTPDLLQALKTPAAKRSTAQHTLINGTWALANLSDKNLDPSWPVIQKSIRECRSGIAKSLIALTIPEKETPVTRILPRGDWQNNTGEIVEPAVLHFLPQPDATGKRKLTRLDLAKWLVSEKNPLTARHVMNRYWKQFFGNGISNVLDDLGSQGEWPSHPELLDWLAHEFRTSNWDTKHMIKLMVMSNTYRQQSGNRKDLKDIDPYNRLLAGQSPRRLDAEFIRDNALSISGLIRADYAGGPSVFPYQPAGYYAPLQFPNRKYEVSQNGDQYRRGIYMHWQRTFLHPMLANFDAPSREECTADRLQSNSPLQALTLLNDPAAVEMAKAFAIHTVTRNASHEARIQSAWLRCLSRPPRTDETTSIQSFYQQQLEHYQGSPEDTRALLAQAAPPKDCSAAELAAWTQVCRVLLNLHETITRY